MDAQRLPLDVPVDHDPAPAIADVPLGREVLVPGTEVLAVRGAGVCALAPDQRITGVERAIGHGGDGLAQLVHCDIAPTGVEQVLVGGAVLDGVHALESGVGAEAVEAQQQAWPQNRAVERLVGRGAAEPVGEAQPQVGLLDDVEQARQRPGVGDFGLEGLDVGRRRPWQQRGQADPAPALAGDADVRVARQALVELGQCRVHLLSQAVDERAGVERQVERLIMAGALRVEVGRQVLVGVAVAVRACHPHLLAAQLVAQGFEGANFVGDAVDARAPLRAYPRAAQKFHHGLPNRSR